MFSMRYFVVLFLIIACGLLPERTREREIQTEILSNLTQKSEDFSTCVKKNDLFNKFNTSRIRIVVKFLINSNGQVSQFQLDEKKYPKEFGECIAHTIEQITFPSIKGHEVIELQQPFIFSKN